MKSSGTSTLRWERSAESSSRSPRWYCDVDEAIVSVVMLVKILP
ncbi:hypothetical protein L838_4620 [Mycobacterium avium MAV_120709_2344]|nr:hypothetical protein L838_4620 [Mycobacterium avium MAV_120709_2344]